MIFMQQMQYNAPNRIQIFLNFSGGYTSEPPFWCCDPEPGSSPLKSWLRTWPMHAIAFCLYAAYNCIFYLI